MVLHDNLITYLDCERREGEGGEEANNVSVTVERGSLGALKRKQRIWRANREDSVGKNSFCDSKRAHMAIPKDCKLWT